MELRRFNFRWPTRLALNPLDTSLAVLDSGILIRVTKEGIVSRWDNKECSQHEKVRNQVNVVTSI